MWFIRRKDPSGMADKVKLDIVDRQILHDLQADSRMTNVDLAKRAGISAPPCLRRVRVLEEAGSSGVTMPILTPMRLAIVCWCLPLLV